MSIKDKRLEKAILAKLTSLEVLNDAVGPTPLRRRMSELIVGMRKEFGSFDEDADMEQYYATQTGDPEDE